MRGHPRLVRFFALFLVALGVMFSFSATTLGQEPQPDYRKLDAALLGAVSPTIPGTQALSDDLSDHLAQFKTYAFTSADGTEFVDGLIKTDGSLDGLQDLGVIMQSVVGEVVAARMPVEALSRLTSLSNVEFIEASRQLQPFNDTSVPSTGATSFHNAGIDGTGAIVVVIDSDIDFTHNDFRNSPSGTTRIKFLCDQTDPPQAGDATCPGLGSPTGGTLWTEAQINTHLQGGQTIRQAFTGTHGTHVAGSAAGNDSTYGGMAPGADIIFVKSTLNSVDVVNSLSFIDQKAGELGLPYVINMSFGGHSGPHDGTDAMSVAINSLVGAGKPGKAVVAAAGNEGGSKIHASADLAGGNQTVQIEVPAGAVQFLLEVWYDGNESFSFSFQDSNGAGASGFTSPTFATEICVTHFCYTVEHSLNQPSHKDSKEVRFLIAPPNGGNQITATGTWSFTLSGTPSSNGVFHAWCNASCTFPNGDTDFTVGEPASAANAITVGAINNKPCWDSLNGQRCYFGPPSQGDIAGFSSKGPTRDGRIKPDIVAPGEGIASALSSNGTVSNDITLPGGTHFVNQGTSMASPHVAGAVALYLAENPSLDAAAILQILKDDAIADVQTGAVPNNSAGHGKMSIAPLGDIPPTLGIADLTVGEGVGDATLTITLGPAADQTVTVDYDTSDGTAIAAEDFSPTSGTISFQAGETSKSVTVAIIDDNAAEDGETFEVAMSNPTGGAQISTANGISTVTIQDNDLAVTKMADTNGTCTPGDCSLREAIASATAGATIVVPAGTYTLDPGLQQLFIGESLTLSGAGANETIIQANAARNTASFEVINIQTGTVTISGVTVRHGNATNGGGIVVIGQDPVSITSSTLSDNDADFGGGIFTNPNAQVTITDSSISGNTAGADGGGIYANSGSSLTLTRVTLSGNSSSNAGGGILNLGSATITNSTISGNSATGQGGGVFNFGASLSLLNTTVASNTATAGFGGVLSLGGGSSATLTNTLFSNSDSDCGGDSIVSQGHNLDSDGTCGLNQSGDLSNVDPNIGPLADNGGPTQTHALLSGSPAIDAGDDTSVPATDQRGVSRLQGPSSDIGAFEVQVAPTVGFPDANLEAAIRDALGKPTGDITTDDMAGLTTLDADNSGIQDLTGLEHATTLTNLVLSLNQISDISSLGSFTSLTTLDLSANQIQNLSAIASLTSLTSLLLAENQISDISALDSLTNLIELGLEGNQISDISTLTTLTNLTGLSLSSNQISDLSALAPLTNLTLLHLQENQISDISALVENEGLSQGDTVDLTDNPLTKESLSTHIPALQARGVDVSFTPTLFIGDATVGESDGTVTLTITLIPQLTELVTVNYFATAGTAVAPGDYTHVSGTATVPAGATSTTISISIAGDAVEEPDETFTVTLSSPTNAQIASDAVTSTVTIVDDDTTASVADVSIDEGTGTLAFPVTLSVASPFDVTLDFTVSDGNAASPVDFAYVGTQGLDATDSLTIPAGSTFGEVLIDIVDDTLDEDDEQFSVRISNPTNATIGENFAVITIEDNDPAPTVSISDATANEADGTIQIIVSIDAVSGRNVTVDYVTNTGTALDGPDFVGTTGTATLPASATSTTVSVPIVDDEIFEIDETFTVVLSNPTNATLASGGGSVGTVTIHDDDVAPTVSIQAAASVVEGNGGAQTQVDILLTLTSVLDTDVTVNFATSDGTATAGQDYVGASDSETIDAGTTSTTIQITVEGDDDDESDETFVLTISNATSAVGGLTITRDTSTVTILDDDGTIVAETSLRPALDDDNVAVVQLRVERLKFAGGELTFDSPNGIQLFNATLTFDPNAVEILDVRDVTEFAGNTTFDSTSTPGQLTISGTIAGAPADIGPLVLAKIVIRLTGSSDAETQLALTGLQVTEATSATVFNQEAQASGTYQRGDVRADGHVRATDRLFLTQCLLGLRDYGTAAGECHPVNAASINHDDPTGDMPTEADGLYISELVVELRDASFNLIP